MLGVHPGHASEWTAEAKASLAQRIADDHPVAIGEIGLDFFRGETNNDEQVTAFTEQLELARLAGIPAAIHMRSSEMEMLDVLNHSSKLPTLLFHSFDGSSEIGSWIIDNDGWIGVGGLSTRKSSLALQHFISKFPHNRVVLETDSPYLVPNGFKHRRNSPESIPFIARHLASLWDTTIAEVAHRTTANAEALFRSLDNHESAA